MGSYLNPNLLATYNPFQQQVPQVQGTQDNPDLSQQRAVQNLLQNQNQADIQARIAQAQANPMSSGQAPGSVAAPTPYGAAMQQAMGPVQPPPPATTVPQQTPPQPPGQAPPQPGEPVNPLQVGPPQQPNVGQGSQGQPSEPSTILSTIQDPKVQQALQQVGIGQMPGINIPEPYKPPQTMLELEAQRQNVMQKLEAAQALSQQAIEHHPTAARTILAAVFGALAGAKDPRLGIEVGQAIRYGGKQADAAARAQQQLDLAKQGFDVTSSVAKTGLDYQKTQAEMQKSQAELQMAQMKYPLEVAEIQQRLAKGEIDADKARLEIQKLLTEAKGTAETQPFTATLKNGTKIPVTQVKIPGGGIQYRDLQGNDVTSQVSDVTKTPTPKQATESENLLQSRVDAITGEPGKYSVTAGNVPPDILEQATKSAETIKNWNANNEAMRRTNAQIDAATQRESNAQLKDAAGTINTPLKAGQIKLNEYLNTLDENGLALKLGDNNTVANNLASITTARTAIGSTSRLARYDVELARGGKWEQLGGYIQSWKKDPQHAGNVTEPVLKQMREYNNAIKGEVQRIFDINSKYMPRIASARSEPAIENLDQQRRNEIAGKTGEDINQGTQGTYDNPVDTSTFTGKDAQQQFDALPPGTYFTKPGDPTIWQKGSGEKKTRSSLDNPVGPVPVGQIPEKLRQIAKRESSFIPTAQNPDSTASGLYGFIDPTWRYVSSITGAGGEYKHAKDAPVDIQTTNALWLYNRFGPNQMISWLGSMPPGGYK